MLSRPFRIGPKPLRDFVTTTTCCLARGQSHPVHFHSTVLTIKLKLPKEAVCSDMAPSAATVTYPASYTAPLRTNAEYPGDRSQEDETLNPISDEKQFLFMKSRARALQ